MGVDNGWALDDSGNILLTSSVASQYSQANVGWIRVEFRLVNGRTTWDSYMLGKYDTAINNARSAGLNVIALIDYTSWPGSMAAWSQNAVETGGTDGANSFITGFANSAVVPIVRHFKDRISAYEIWNEPNETTNFFVQPSCYSQMLYKTYSALNSAGLRTGNTFIFGGVSGTGDIWNGYTYAKAGAQYIDDVYAAGRAYAHWDDCKASLGTYPLDAIGQHIYLNGTDKTNVKAANVTAYLNFVRQAYAKYEGPATTKRTWITEFGWTTQYASYAVQASNLTTSFNTYAATPWVEHAIWFSWKDSDAAGLYFGLLDSSLSPKTSYTNFTASADYYGRKPDGTFNAAIRSYMAGQGQAKMGNPFDSGGTPFVHTVSAAGHGADVQDSDGGSRKRLTVISSSYGTYAVDGAHGFYNAWNAAGGMATLGPPRNDAHAAGSGTRQDFIGWYIAWNPSGGTVCNQYGLVDIAKDLRSGGGLGVADSAQVQYAGSPLGIVEAARDLRVLLGFG